MTVELPTRLPYIGLDGITLKAGGHPERSIDGVCAMEAAAWLAGEPHSDHPACACPVIGAFMRSWNDNIKDDATRTRLLKPLLPLVLDTRSTPAIELQRSWMAIDWLAREHASAWLSLRDDSKAHAVALRGLKPITDTASAREAQSTLDAAWAAAGDAPRDAARDAAWAAAWDAAGDAAWAAAWAAAGDAARDAAWAAAGDAARDALNPTVEALQLSAQDLVRRMCAVGRG